MHLLVNIEVPVSGLDAFNTYEDWVLSRLADHGGKLEMRMRSPDNTQEVHLVTFPDASARDAFLADPVRQKVQPFWTQSGAGSVTIELERIDA